MREEDLGFTYPPFSALLFAPFAHVAARRRRGRVLVLQPRPIFALIAVCLRAVCNEFDRRTILWWALVLLVPVVMLDPVRQTFLLGQVNIFLALMVVADLTLDLPLPRGVLVGLAAAIKVTPIILIPYLLLTRQGRAGAGAVASSARAALLAAAVNFSTSWSYWTHYIRDPQRAGMLSWIGNQGVLGALERMIGHTVSTPTTFVIVVSPPLGLAVAAAAYRRSSPLLGLLVVEATESLANPVSWSHHFIWVVLLIAWLALAPDRPRYGEWRARRRRAVLGRAALVGAARPGDHLRRAGMADPALGLLRAALHRPRRRRRRIRVFRAGPRPAFAPARERGAVGPQHLTRPSAPSLSAVSGRARRPDSIWLLVTRLGCRALERTARQPVTTNSFSGSPGRNSSAAPRPGLEQAVSARGTARARCGARGDEERGDEDAAVRRGPGPERLEHGGGGLQVR